MGTGKAAAIPGYTAAGKTGTAQKAVPGAGYSKDRYVASFIGFTPADRPRVVIAVVVDEPKGKTYGAEVAAPVFSAIGADVLRILREAPAPLGATRPSILTADLGAGRRGRRAQRAPECRRPRARREPGRRGPTRARTACRTSPGKSARDAVRLLASRGLSARLSGTGFVVSQEPPAGSPAERGGSCALHLAPARSRRERRREALGARRGSFRTGAPAPPATPRFSPSRTTRAPRCRERCSPRFPA